jgi:putative ABC transport system permease protein
VRNILVVAEVALSVVLLFGAGLLIHSFVRLQTVDLEFDPDNILISRLPFPRAQYKTPEDKHRFFRELLARLHALPGVLAAAESTNLPPYAGIRSEIEIAGKTHTEKWQSVFQLCR